jgi:uncharacterized damage-inducible protein DinB
MVTRALGVCVALLYGASLSAQDLRAVLLKQLQSTHDKKEWFVSVKEAVADLSPEQASWRDGKGNHSVGQLANHLLFWNRRELEKFTGVKSAKFNGNNDETFEKFDTRSWTSTLRELDEVMTGIEKVVREVDETKLKGMAEEIGNIATHNAYHTGQMVFVRKEQGVWNSEKGVK